MTRKFLITSMYFSASIQTKLVVTVQACVDKYIDLLAATLPPYNGQHSALYLDGAAMCTPGLMVNTVL